MKQDLQLLLHYEFGQKSESLLKFQIVQQSKKSGV